MIVTDTKLESKEVILCVDIEADELPPSIRTLMTDHAFELVHCESVYEALARIKSVNPVIALVRVDWLTVPEFEFFSICTRSYAELCIFVVGEDRCGAKIERAIQAGASARLSSKSVEGILAEHCCEASFMTSGDAGIDDWGDSADGPEGGELPENNSDTFASADNEFDAESEAPFFGSSSDVVRDSDLTDTHEPKTQSAIDPGESGAIETTGVGVQGAGAQPASYSSHSPTDARGSSDTPEVSAEIGQEPLAGLDVEDASEGYEVDHAADDETDGETFNETDEECRPVIVPWADSSRSANRVPPKGSGPTRPAAPVEEIANTAEELLPEEMLPEEMLEDDPPLLSAEELSLLLGE
jgi:hypothetical protein